MAHALFVWLSRYWDGKGVFNNLAAEMIWTLIAFFLVALVAIFLLTRNHRTRIAFFGLDRRCPSASIFVSNIMVRQSIAFEPLTAGYRGPAITKVEYEAALRIQAELTKRPLVVVLEPLQNWISRRICRRQDVATQIRLSPRGDDPSSGAEAATPPPLEGHLTDGSNVSIGSPIYNSIAKWYLEEYLPNPANGYESWFAFGRAPSGERTIQRMRHSDVGPIELPRAPAPTTPGADRALEPAFVMRLKHDGKTIFLCAGIAGWATAQSVHYLAENWSQMHRAMGDAEFAMALMCEPPASDQQGTYKTRSYPPFRLKRAA